MRSINRRAIAALLFGFLTFGAGASVAQEPAKEHSCSSKRCCKDKPAKRRQAAPTSTNSFTSQWYKAKFGREYPGPLKKPAELRSKAATHNCCC